VAKRKQPKAWSYTAGRPARAGRDSTLVRVFERPDKPGRLLMSCAWRKSPSGAPRQEQLPADWTREQAEQQAEITAGERARVLLEGVPEGNSTVTLDRLLRKYHDSRKAGKWSEGHRRDQERARRFWLDVFGEDRPCRSITPDEMETEAQTKADAEGWTVRTHRKYLKYLKAAGRYGRRKAGLFPDMNTDPWEAVDLPTEAEADAPEDRERDEPEELVYTDEEVARLCTPRPRKRVPDKKRKCGWRWEGQGIDWRVTLACNIAADTGRRIGSIRQLKIGDVLVQPSRVWLRMWKSTDKGRKLGRVPVTTETAELILATLKRPEVQEHGWLLPGGHEGSKRGSHAPWGGFDITGSSGPIAKLHAAEELLGIPRVRCRAYHGVKKAHVTVSWEEAGGDAAKVGDLTGNTSHAVLERHYRKPPRAATEEHQDKIRARFSGRSHTEAIPQKTGSA